MRAAKAKIQPQVWRTTNGRNWLPGSGFEGLLGTLNDVLFADSNRGWAVGAIESNGQSLGAIFCTNDGGISWEKTFDAKVGFLNRVLVTATNTIWAVGEREILKSIDGGKSWKSSYGEVNVDFFAIASPKAGSIVVVGSEGTILFSENSGDSWHPAKLDPAAKEMWFSAVGFVNESTGYAAGGFGGRSGLVVTRDGGESWSIIDINLSDGFIQDIALKDGKIFLLGADGSIARR